MPTIDLNCDMGEGMITDEAIMPYISSANIACGFHAGDEDTIQKTISLCLKYNVAIGAHPGFADKKNFGRLSMQLSTQELYDVFAEQLMLIKNFAEKSGARLHHVKPHGAMYNMAATNKVYAQTLAKATKDIDDHLIFYGLSNSCMIEEAKALQLQTASEVFADRTYQENGTLTPRSEQNALITDNDEMIRQALALVTEQKVKMVSGKIITVQADTICLHGDGAHADIFAKEIFETLVKAGITIETI